MKASQSTKYSYQFQCGSSAVYIGKTERALYHRMIERTSIWFSEVMTHISAIVIFFDRATV